MVLSQLLKLLGTLLLGVRLERTSQSSTKTLQVRATLNSIDIVDIRVEVLRIARIVHDSNLNRHILLLSIEIDDIVDEMSTCRVDIAHEVSQTSLAVKNLAAHPLYASSLILVET